MRSPHVSSGPLRLTAVLPILCLAGLLIACAASGAVRQVVVQEHAQAPDFSAASLDAGGLAIVGFEGSVTDDEVKARDRLDYPLYAAIRTAHENLALIGAKTVRSRLRAAGLHESVHELLAADDLARLPYEALRGALAARYVLSAKLVNNLVLETAAESDEEASFCTTRAASVRYRVIDLRQRREAWSGVLQRQGESCQKNGRTNTLADAKLGGGEIFAALIIDVFSASITDTLKGRHPAPPALDRVLAKCARDLALALPGAAQPQKPTPPTRRLHRKWDVAGGS